MNIKKIDLLCVKGDYHYTIPELNSISIDFILKTNNDLVICIDSVTGEKLAHVDCKKKVVYFYSNIL